MGLYDAVGGGWGMNYQQFRHYKKKAGAYPVTKEAAYNGGYEQALKAVSVALGIKEETLKAMVKK